MNSTYKIDFINNTLTMSKAFEAAASNPNSKEYKLLQQLRADFPGLTVARKTRRASKKAQPTKNLTYANMEKYMSVFENASDLLAQFEAVKTCSKGQSNPYLYVKGWFVTQFPNYKELPDFSEKAPKVVDLAAFQNMVEQKKEQEEQKGA